MTGREMYERWCAHAAIPSAWPEDAVGEDLVVARAWDKLAADVEEDRRRAVADVVARRDG